MYYFEKQGNIINKYIVEFDVNELRKLNDEIITNYSTITHKESEGSLAPYYDGNTREFRNIKSTQIGVNEYIDGTDKTIYLFTYDEYFYPRISIEINNLLKGDITAINRIFAYEEEKEYLKSKLSRLTSSFNLIDKNEFDDPLDYLESQIKELNNLKYSLDSLNYNLEELEKEKSILDKYGEELKRNIKIELVDSIDEEELNKVSAFLDINLEPFSTNDKISDNVRRQLKNFRK